MADDILSGGTVTREPAFQRKLEAILGYWQNGTDTCVYLGQDDATREYSLTVGDRVKTSYHGTSLADCVNQAYEAAPEENK